MCLGISLECLTATSLCACSNFCGCSERCGAVVIALLESTHIWIWTIVVMIATHALQTLHDADFSENNAPVYIGVVIGAWIMPMILVFKVGKLVGGRTLYLAGSIVVCSALFINADISETTVQYFWPALFTGLGLSMLTNAIDLLLPCQDEQPSKLLRYAEWSSAVIGSLIGGPCSYYMSILLDTKITIRIFSGICFVCFMVILRVVQPYDERKIRMHTEIPRAQGTLAIFFLSSGLCGAISWVPIFGTFLVASIDHKAGKEYAVWQLATACSFLNIAFAAVVALCMSDTVRIAAKLIPVASLIVGLCMWGFTLTDSHGHHIWLTIISSIACAGLRTYVFSWMSFFPQDTYEWSRGIASVGFGGGALMGIGFMSFAGSTDLYLRWMILVAVACGVLGVLLALQQKETFSSFYAELSTVRYDPLHQSVSFRNNSIVSQPGRSNGTDTV